MTDKVRAALDAYAAASGEQGDDQYFLWDIAWSLIDHCEKRGMDFVAIVEEARSERARIIERESWNAPFSDPMVREHAHRHISKALKTLEDGRRNNEEEFAQKKAEMESQHEMMLLVMQRGFAAIREDMNKLQSKSAC